MTAVLKFSGSLRDIVGGQMEVLVVAGETVRTTLMNLGIVPEMIALVVVNEQQQTKDYVIKDDDVIRVLAVIGGG